MTTVANENGVLRVVVVGYLDDDDLRQALTSSEGPIELAAAIARGDDATSYLDTPGIDAVLLCAIWGASSTELAEEAKTIRQHTDAPIILLMTEAEDARIETLLMSGADDVLILPQRVETLSFTIRKALRSRSRDDEQAPVPVTANLVLEDRLTTVFSPKGGTGKTVLSTNLAAYLASGTDKRVLLIDLDLQFGDAAIMLGLEPERTLHDLVLAPGELDAGKLVGYTTRHRSGLSVLAAPMRPEQAELVTEEKVLRLLKVAREAYDIVIVDTSPFFYGPMLALLAPTDRLLLLSGLDVPTLKNVRLSLRTLNLLGFPASKIDLVLNRVSTEAGITSSDAETALGQKVRFEIPNDPIVAPAVNLGTVPALLEPESPFALAVGEIAEALVSGSAPARSEARVPVTQRPRLRRFVPRRLQEGKV